MGTVLPRPASNGMNKKFKGNCKIMLTSRRFWSIVLVSILVLWVGLYLIGKVFGFGKDAVAGENNKTPSFVKGILAPIALPLPQFDAVLYDRKMLALANYKISTSTATSTSSATSSIISAKVNLWPVKTVYPNVGAILPSKRIIAYYGNLYSKKMGALGEYPEDEMLRRLDVEVKKWSFADPETPAIPALHYIAVTAQIAAGKDRKYRLRMPHSQIDKIIVMAAKIDAIVFLDIQVGLSTLQSEIPQLEKYLKMPNVHLGIDPEFSMKTGARPGTVVGTTDAADINFAANYLAKIVKDNNLPPKVLVIHRFTQRMVTNYRNIKPLPEVQIVMHMDGWGPAAQKINTYKQFVYKEPVQFGGFKLFYKHDTRKAGAILMSPNDLLKLSPQPMYIQYQ